MGRFITSSLTGPEVDVTYVIPHLERRTRISCILGTNNAGVGGVVMWENPFLSFEEKEIQAETLCGEWGYMSSSSPPFMVFLQSSFSRFLWKGLVHISWNTTERKGPSNVLKAAALFYQETNKNTAGKTGRKISHCLLSFSITSPFSVITVCLWTLTMSHFHPQHQQNKYPLIT